VYDATVAEYFEWNLGTGDYAMIQQFNISVSEANKLFRLAQSGDYEGGSAIIDCAHTVGKLLKNIPTFKPLDSSYWLPKSLYRDLNKIGGVY